MRPARLMFASMIVLFQLPGNLYEGVPALVVERVKDGERGVPMRSAGLDSCRRFHNEGDICPFQAQHGRGSRGRHSRLP